MPSGDDAQRTSVDLFGGELPPGFKPLTPEVVRLRREADILLLAVPELPGSLWLDRDSLPPARELVRQGRARMAWLREPGVYELRRAAHRQASPA